MSQRTILFTVYPFLTLRVYKIKGKKNELPLLPDSGQALCVRAPCSCSELGKQQKRNPNQKPFQT